MSASFLLGLRNALLLRPRATFALSGARSALSLIFSSQVFSRAPQRAAASPSCYVRVGQRSLRTSPALKPLLFYDRQMAAHTGTSCLLRIPRCETGCDACSHKSAKSAENIELPYLWLRNDGGTEPDRGHSVSFSWPAYPSVGR